MATFKNFHWLVQGFVRYARARSILKISNVSGAEIDNSSIAGKFDGYSEAWSKSTFPVKSIKELMRLTEEYEEKK